MDVNLKAGNWALDDDARWWLAFLVVKALVAVGLVMVLK